MNLSEIAASLHVSPASISIVRHGKPGVSPAMRRRIQLALETNGFTYKHYVIPEALPESLPPTSKRFARLLKYSRSALLTDRNEGFVNRIIQAIEAYARSVGYAIMLNTVGYEEYSAFLSGLEGDPCAGMLVLATEMEPQDILELQKLRVPVVIIDCDYPNLPFSSVTMDNRGLAHAAVDHLFTQGAREVGYLRSKIRTGNFTGRENGWREALLRRGITPEKDIIFDLMPSLADARQEMAAHLAAGRPLPRAFFADNDVIAIGAMQALTQHGVSVPEQCMIIGVDNTMLTQISTPTLSSMQILFTDIGQMAISTLIRHMDAPSLSPQDIHIRARLVIRESTSSKKVSM